MSDVTVVQTPKGHTTIHYKGKMLATISGAGRTREDRLKLANTMADALTREDDNSIPVNGVEARKALEEISKIAEDWREHSTTWASALDSICDLAKKALSTHPRQCDVGTAEAQTTRYRKFCFAHKYLGSDFSYTCKGFGKGRCPFFNSYTKGKCEFEWAQMPYEPQERGAE